jgi:hypothetical protein
MEILPRPWRVLDERGSTDLRLAKTLAQMAEEVIVEAGADLAHVPKPLLIPHPD